LVVHVAMSKIWPVGVRVRLVLMEGFNVSANVKGVSVSSPRSSLKSVVSDVEEFDARFFFRIVSKPELYSAVRVIYDMPY